MLEEGRAGEKEEDGEDGKEARWAEIERKGEIEGREGEKRVRWAKPLCTYRRIEGRTVRGKRRRRGNGLRR